MPETNDKMTKKQKERIGRYFFYITIAIELILMYFLFLTFKNSSDELLKSLAIGIVILWVGILVAYYSWAIYFYNINLGITDKDWDDIEQRRGTPDAIKEPEGNPNSEQTFGLPPGTVRGSIALTLLIVTIAMILVSFNTKNIVKDNETFIDNFDFFKNAFLMMIAFYFGQKSLETLLSNQKDRKNHGKDGQSTQSQQNNDAKG
ncbi:MAG TPA: hypothetical protein VIH57_06045 [Bacteroidales bacterium]